MSFTKSLLRSLSSIKLRQCLSLSLNCSSLPLGFAFIEVILLID